MDTPGLRVVTLITDFGWQDAYVGQLKGQLLRGCAQLLPIDLNHSIPPWDVAAAARCLYDSYGYFPRGSIHLVVVDPGVGSERRLLAAAGQGHIFITPDNGTLELLLAERRIEKAHCIESVGASPSGTEPSPTFHGRDILAPAAARLACGCPLAELGPALAVQDLVRLQGQRPVRADASAPLDGLVLAVDHFGNIRTSFHPARDNICSDLLYAVTIHNILITRRVRCYSDAPKGALCFLIDSGGYLEIAIHQGNAAQALFCKPGDLLRLHLKNIHTQRG